MKERRPDLTSERGQWQARHAPQEIPTGVTRNQIIQEPVQPIQFKLVSESAEKVDSEEMVVAVHELQHAIPAHFMGAQLKRICVEPGPGYLGITEYSGHVPLEVFQISAAGSMVNSYGWKPEGYGDDKNKVDFIHHKHGGRSTEAAMREAAKYHAKVPDSVIRIMAQTLVRKGEIAGNDFQLLLEEATLKASLDPEITIPKVRRSIFFPETVAVNAQAPEIITHKENLGNYQYKIYEKINGIKDDKSERYLCAKCQGINGHTEECILRPEQEPGSITIFDRKEISSRAA